jgi:hypothetical protein
MKVGGLIGPPQEEREGDMSRRAGWKDLLIYLVFVVLVLAFFFAISGTRAPRIPADAVHRPTGPPEVCRGCHGPGGADPLPSRHPDKERCTSCHKMAREKR